MRQASVDLGQWRRIIRQWRAWEKDAACAGMPTEWWYGEPAGQGAPGQLPAGMRRALYTCWSRCKVRRECLSTALEMREEWGIWGGAVPADRRRGGLEEVDRRARRRAEYMGLIWTREEMR